jgi:hypothetical protein
MGRTELAKALSQRTFVWRKQPHDEVFLDFTLRIRKRDTGSTARGVDRQDLSPATRGTGQMSDQWDIDCHVTSEQHSLL